MIFRRLLIAGLATAFAVPAFAQQDGASKPAPRPQPPHSHAQEKGSAPIPPARPEATPASGSSAEKLPAPKKQPRHDHSRDAK
jgi:hypothetical protein